MEEEYAVSDPTQLLDAASEFAYHPGAQSDNSTKEFLDRFPLPVIISALQTKGDVPGFENALVTCLERIFRTRYGASLIPHYMPFVVVGLGAESQKVRCVACKIVSCLLENPDQTDISATDLLIQHDVYPLLLKCVVEGDEQVATAAVDAIRKLAGCPEAMEIIFPANTNHPTHLSNVAAECSSLGRVRILALVVKLFSISNSVASTVYNSNLLGLLEAEVSNEKDTLATLSALELFYEVAEVQHSTQFLSRTTLLQLLSSLISNPSSESMLRARAMMIIGRLMSKANVFSFIDESSVKSVISAIDGRLGRLDNLEANECECAIEALGQIGTTVEGATLLLSDSPPAARHVVDAAFGRNGHGKKLAALHALGNIAGETRSESNRLLNYNAEEILKRLIYETASKSSKFSPSVLLLSALQMESEIRLAGYRLITGLAARSWCLMEICSRQEIINIVTDTFAETTKIGMESRHNCCEAIVKALSAYPNLQSDPFLAGVAAKLDEAVKRGPYLAKNKRPEAQPAVMTAERF